MGYNIELEDGGRITLVYFNNFTWKSELEAKMLGNQPYVGRVYRAFVEPETNAYFVQVPDAPEVSPEDIQKLSGTRPLAPRRMGGVRFTSLNYSTPEFDVDMTEVTDANIIDLEITPEDYKKISDWSESSHQDFVKELYGTDTEEATGVDVITSMQDIEDLDEKDMLREIGTTAKEDFKNQMMSIFNGMINPLNDQLSVNIKFIMMRDPLILEALAGVTSNIRQRLQEEDKSDFIPLSREIALSPSLGKGANVYSAMANLEAYTRNDRAPYLEEAIYDLLVEYARLKTRA